MNRVKKAVSFLMILVMFCAAVIPAAMADAAGWRILESQQIENADGDDYLDVWFTTDEQISKGMAIYKYGGITLPEEDLNDMVGIGYIFVVDDTAHYSGTAKNIDPETIIAGAIDKMSQWDSVAFIGVREADLGATPEFSAKGSWEKNYKKTFNERPAGTSAREYTWEAVSKAISFAQQSYQQKTARAMVLIIITDGAERSLSKKGTDCITEILKLSSSFTLPVYCLHLSPTKDDGKFLEFVDQLNENGGKGFKVTVTKDTAARAAAECVLPYSKMIYRARLKLDYKVYFAAEDNHTLTVSLAGSQKGAPPAPMDLDLSKIPTPTPEPTSTPEPTPTPEANPQFVGDGVGNEHDIWELQRELIRLGFMPEGEPTGIWDAATIGGVNLYYSMNGITTDRIPARGGMTREVYDEFMEGAKADTIATPTPAPTVTPTAAPTPTPTVDPENGIFIGYDTENRSDTRSLNRVLKEKYYLEEDADASVYGDATQAAVDAFYKDHPDLKKPLGGEGITKNAYEELLKADAKATPTPTPVVTEDPYPAYISPSTENYDLVAELNRKLKDNYYVANPDAIELFRYNEETSDAVERFYEYCKEQNVPETLVPKPSVGTGITREAYQFLLASGPMPTATPNPDVMIPYTEEGIKSTEGLTAIRRLTELGYLAETSSDTKLTDFMSALLWFAQRTGITLDSGEYLDKQTYELLMSGTAKQAEDPPEEILPGKNEPKEQIIEFQGALKRLNYFRDIQAAYKPGTFDESTVKAYERFCEVNGIAWDGGSVSWENQKNVLSSAKENPALGLLENTKLFITRDYKLFGLMIPIWALLLVIVLILAAVVAIVIILAKGKKTKGGEMPTFSDLPADMAPVSVSMDEPTAELEGSDVSTGLDAPTVDPEGCVLTLMITYPSGTSRDVSYNVQDGEQLIIGRGSTADIVTDTEDMSVSRKHGVFHYSAKMITYEDTSSHYSVLDGEKIHLESRELKQGSTLQIGKSIIKVQWS